MRAALPALLIGLMLSTSAIAQSGGGSSSSSGGAASSGATTGAASVPGASGSPGTTTGIGQGAGSPAAAPVTVNEQMRTNSGAGLQTPPATTVPPGTTVGQSVVPGGAEPRRCTNQDCSSPLSGRYMSIVNAMARSVGVRADR